MGIRTRGQYLDGLLDDRAVYYQGQRVPKMLDVPELRLAAERSALAFDMQHDPLHADLAVDESSGEQASRLFTVPRSVADLEKRAELIERGSALGGGILLLKEVGTDAMFALLRALDGEGLDRARVFYEHCRRGDLVAAVGQTDPKGDRSLAPHEQVDPDLYLRVVDEDADRIVVRGAKTHTSFSVYADELIVLPTRAMGPKDADYALSFAVPVATPGVTLYASPYLAGERNPWDHPLSSRTSLIETLTVFDDVVVPKERVFLNRRAELAGPLALAFVGYHRFSAVNYKLVVADLIVGAAHLAVEANGTGKAGHVRDKLGELIRWAETVRGLIQLAAQRSKLDAAGVQTPDPLAVNMAKYEFAHRYMNSIATLVDLAGALVVTGPGSEDWDNPDIRPILEKYYRGAVPGARRLQVINLISELAVRDYAGYQSALASHAEGSMEAEKMQLIRSYSPTRAIELAERLGNIDGAKC